MDLKFEFLSKEVITLSKSEKNGSFSKIGSIIKQKGLQK